MAFARARTHPMMNLATEAAGNLGAGLGDVGHRYLTEEGRTAAAAKVAQAEYERRLDEIARRALDKTAQDEGIGPDGTPAAPIPVADVPAPGPAPMPAAPPGVPSYANLGAPPAGMTPPPVPVAPPPGAAPVPMARPPMPPMPRQPMPGPGPMPAPAGVAPARIQGAGAPPPRMPPAVDMKGLMMPQGMPPAGPPRPRPATPPSPMGALADGGMQPNPAFDKTQPRTDAYVNGTWDPGSNPAYLGKAGSPVAASARPGSRLQDTTRTGKQIEDDLRRERIAALAFKRPDLYTSAMGRGSALRERDDPRSVAEDTMALAGMLDKPDALRAWEPTTRAGAEAKAQALEILHGEKRQDTIRGEANALRERIAGAGNVSKEKIAGDKETNADRRAREAREAADTRARLDRETRERIAGMPGRGNVGKPPAAPKAPKPTITLDQFIENEKSEMNRAEADAKAAYDDSMNVMRRPRATPDEQVQLRQKWTEAQKARRGYNLDAARERWLQKYGGTAPADPAATAPKAGAAAPAPPPPPGTPTGAPKKITEEDRPSAKDIIDAADQADAAGDSAEVDRLRSIYQNLYGEKKSKPFIASQGAEPPSEGGQVGPGGEGSKKVALFNEIKEKGLDDASRRTKYEGMIAGTTGNPSIDRLSPEDREKLVARTFDEDEAAVTAMHERSAKFRAADEAGAAANARAAADAEAKKKRLAEESKARLGGAAGFLGR